LAGFPAAARVTDGGDPFADGAVVATIAAMETNATKAPASRRGLPDQA
jgi:hypothetical protein